MAVPTTYDAVFERRLSVPVAYARSLAWMESGLDPRNETGSHWGLFQVGPENLADYNKAHPTKEIPDADRLQPEPNTIVWAWEAERIRKALTDAGLKEDWSNPEWVKLFTAGWNSGYSRTAGVAHVLAWLREHNLPLTHDNVFAHAREAGGAWTLQDEDARAVAKKKYQRDVAALYAKEAARDSSSYSQSQVSATAAAKAPKRTSATVGGIPWWVVVALLLALGDKRGG